MARPAILCCLPIDECTPVGTALTEAGFAVLHAANATEAGPMLAKRRDIGVAIIDGETDFDDSLELYSLLHGNGVEVPTLMVVSPKAFERLTTNTHGRRLDRVLHPALQRRVAALAGGGDADPLADLR